MTTTGNTPKSQGETLKQDAKKAAASTSEDIKSEARKAADTVSAQASGYADQAKQTAADEVKDVASALRTAADELRSGSPQERTFSQIADGLADASDAVRGKDLSEIVNDVNGFAKRNPLMFLGGAALVGFAATRFAKASGTSGRGYDRTATGAASTGRSTGMDRPAPAPTRSPVAGSTPAAPRVETGGKS
ncbi:hypothetical protein [Pseudosulfitobacter koreensis]|uniref:Late embryogenesis abundant protein n=1 Tax=Pseudosulfitobacter koreensis TaxID=2968472 RepID=A0ABT1Z0M3_9RHOB|nr:hypothetical protein [Pseudosulfitobacter koreense]MCR8826698.1 hypothetical protein [Pseudosulfitobacter koreense]